MKKPDSNAEQSIARWIFPLPNFNQKLRQFESDKNILASNQTGRALRGLFRPHQESSTLRITTNLLRYQDACKQTENFQPR
jgi:hypothetical protein